MTQATALSKPLLTAMPISILPPAGPIPKPTFKRTRSKRRRCFYALKATQFQICMPDAQRLGYLTQSKLIMRAQGGDTEARNRVWAANARLAYSVINRFRVRADLMADAFQQVQIGLYRALRLFDVERLNEFSSYAFPAMRSYAIRHRSRVNYAVPLPAHRIVAYYRFRARVVEAPSRSHWFDARTEFLDRDQNEYRALVRLHGVAAPAEIESARNELASTHAPEDTVVAGEVVRALLEVLPSLEERQQAVITRRFGLCGMCRETLDHIGWSLGLTRERVRQIQNQALADLRELLRGRGWSDLPPALAR